MYHSLRLETAAMSRTVDQPEDLAQNAFDRFRTRVFSQNFVPYKFHPRKSQFEPINLGANKGIYEITVKEKSHAPASVSPEAYAIAISNDGQVVIDIVSPIGAVRAFDTLAQAFYAHSKESLVYTPYAPLNIKDAPFFEHRGLNLDISRNWIPPEDVLRSIEAIGFNKMNRLHIHASDSQSWPLVIPSHPNLSQKGAYREDQIWRAKDLENVQRHGLYHGVEVYLEIDMPSHTGAISHAFPDLVTAYNERPWSKYAQEPPSGQLCLNSPDVRSFLETLLRDLLPRISRFDSRFHLGGDELNTEAYLLDPTVRSSSREVIKPFLQQFFDHAISLVEAHGLTPYIWQDMLLEWDLKPPSSTVFQVSTEERVT